MRKIMWLTLGVSVAGLCASSLILYINYDVTFVVSYGIFFYTMLFANIVSANKNVLASVYAIGVMLYFYQVPLIYLWTDSKDAVYALELQEVVLQQYFLLYAAVLTANCMITQLLIRINLSFAIEISKKKIERSIIVSLSLTLVMLLYASYQAGGIIAYLGLNKFESIAVAKLAYFTWKDFLSLSIMLFFLLKSKNVIFLFFIVFFIGVEVLTAKRLMLMVFGVFFYIAYIQKMTLKSFFLLVVALLSANFLKFTYYNLKAIAVSGNSFASIFWFDWNEFFLDSLLIGEFSGHSRLSYLFMYHDIDYSYLEFLHQFLIGLPLGHQLISDYVSVGVYMQSFLQEEWSALGGNMYLAGYVSLGLLGVMLVYLIFAFYLIAFSFFAKRSGFARLLLLSMLPYILFYSQREEISLVFKNLYVLSICLLLVLILTYVVGLFGKSIRLQAKVG